MNNQQPQGQQIQEKPKKSIWNRWWFWLVVAFVIVIAIYFFSGQKIESTKEAKATWTTVTKIIDGDTIVIEGGDHLRLLGIDADESDASCYKEAKDRLATLILTKDVIIEREQTDKDQYGRLLRYVFIDGQNINLLLVKEGLAICRFYEPDIKYKTECASFEQEAKKNKVGCKWEEVKVTAPDLVGKKKAEAESIITESELKVGKVTEKASTKTIGIVLIQDPKAGTKVSKNTPINLVISKAVEVVVPEKKCTSLTKEKTGLEIIKSENAKDYLYEEKIVEGKVASIRTYSNPSLFINFCMPYPDQCFTAIIWNSDWYKFPENADTLYDNKTVRVKGIISEYAGIPQIELGEPSQIEVCD